MEGDQKFQQALTDIHLVDPRYRINYFIPHPVQDLAKASPFQGATPGMIATARLLEYVMLQPADVRELCAGWPEIALFRTSGLITHRVMPVDYSAFEYVVNLKDEIQFGCVLSSEENAEYVSECLANHKNGWLHLSTKQGAGSIQLENLTRKHIIEYVSRRLSELEKDTNNAIFAKTVRSYLDGKSPSSIKIKLKQTRHNLTRPNEMALESFGCKLPNKGPESPKSEEGAVDWILKSADSVFQRRSELLNESKLDMAANAILLTLPGQFRGFRKKEAINKLRKAFAKDNAPVAPVIRSLIAPTTYMHYFEGMTPKGFFGNAMIRQLITTRKKEMMLYSAILIRLSAGFLLPTLRLVPSANRAWGELKHLADCKRSDGPRKKAKLNRLFLRAQEALNEGLNDQFLNRLRLLNNRVNGVKLVTDLPLEWLRVDGVPLGLLHECSRIPVVPSSLGYAIAADQNPVFVSPLGLTDVLIIRSFLEDDPIHHVLERALEVVRLSTAPWQVKYTIVDVQTVEELIVALNKFSGAIVIFDCHGGFDQDGYFSSLIIGGRQVDLNDYRLEINRIPPIVLLSACDTLPIDGSHASATTAMLLLGAKTVLGTLLPVNAARAAIFIARLLLRIGDFVPAALKLGRRMSWREVVANMIKMTYITDCLEELVRQKKLNREGYELLHLDTIFDINTFVPNWYEKFVERLTTTLGCTVDEVKSFLTNDVGLTEALLYVQVGNPEIIILVDSEPEDFIKSKDTGIEQKLT